MATHNISLLERLALIALVLSGSSASCAQADGEAQQTAAQVATVERIISATMIRSDVPGITAAVALRGKLILNSGYGTADLENHVPATAQTLIRTASVSKWFTATAAMRLVEEGKLDLEAPPQRYCKLYPYKRWPMKVRQLLNHTAGVRHYFGSNGEPQGSAADRAELARRQREERASQFIRYTDTIAPVSAFKDDPLLFEPGTQYRYTSHGYRLLGCVLAEASGEPYDALMARTVFHPAGMLNTTVDDAWAVIEHRASGYTQNTDGTLRRANFRDVSENLPAGGHLSTARDLVLFALAFNAGRLVKPATTQRMLENPRVDPGKTDRDPYYGFGVHVHDLPGGHRLLSHDGAQDGTSTCLESVPDMGLAVAVMMNKDGVNAEATCDAIRESLMTLRQ